LRAVKRRRKGHAAAEESVAAEEKRGIGRPADKPGMHRPVSVCPDDASRIHAITSDPKSFTFTPAVDEFEEIEWRELIDLDAISRLIGSTKDPRAGARSYLDALEEQAIFSLGLHALSKGDREALELSIQVIRPLFDELADTFVEPYRETNPALVERGRQMLLALLKAASMIGAPSGPIAPEIETDVRDRAAAQSRASKIPHQEKFAKAVKAEADHIRAEPAKSAKFVRAVAPGLKRRLDLKSEPGKYRIFAAVDLIRAWKCRGQF
jgi:hypothetical protein